MRSRALVAAIYALSLALPRTGWSREAPVSVIVSTGPAELDPWVVETLLEAERYYDDGLQAIKAGRTAEGREKIGQAFTLLSAVVDEDKLTGELREDFEDMLDDIRTAQSGEPSVESSDLEVQADELTAAKALAAPQAAGGESYEIPIDTTSEITKKYLSVYISKKRKQHVLEALERSGLYRAFIEKALRDNGMPRELFYLVMVESEFKPKAVSRAGAAGLWQLMPGTARKLGLEVNYWVDERYDPEKSTKAALKYLKELHDWFGDWRLALASYNRGEGGIGSDMTFAKATRFDQLTDRHALPRETSDYMPKFAACLLIGENPQAFGFEPEYETPAPYEVVTVDKPLDLDIAAKCAGTTVDELKALNPRLRAWCTPEDHPGFELRLPQGKKETFLANLAEVKDWNPARELMRYRVSRGDTLGRIALKFHTSPAKIMADNHIPNARRLKPGMVLKVRPGRPAAHHGRSKKRRR